MRSSPSSAADPTATSSGTTFALGHRPELDGIRGIAATMILVYHVGVPRFLGAGQEAMELFFVLSGFLITSVLVEQVELHGRVHFRQFYLRRAARLVPGAYAYIAVVLVCARFASVPEPGHVGISALVSALYAINWWEALVENRSGLFGGMWSLAVEEQFYAVWPFVIALVGRRFRTRSGGTIVFGLLVAAVVVRWYGSHHWSIDRMRNGTDTRGLGLVLGACVAFLVRQPWVMSLNRRWAAGLALTASGYLLLVPFGVRTYDQRTFLTWWLAAALASAVLVLCCVVRPPGSGTLTAALRTAPLTAAGRISYGMYLVHPLVIFFLDRDRSLPWPTRLVAVLSITVGIATLSYRYFESPIRVWVRDRTASPRRADPPVTGPHRPRLL